MVHIEKYFPHIILGSILLFLIYIVFSLPIQPYSLRSDTSPLNNLEGSSGQAGAQGKLSASSIVYGFSIGKYSKAYPSYAFEKTNVIYDRIAGESVVVARDAEGKVMMSHADTGEIFIPIEVSVETWLASHPDTLIFSHND